MVEGAEEGKITSNLKSWAFLLLASHILTYKGGPECVSVCAHMLACRRWRPACRTVWCDEHTLDGH